MNTLVDDFIQSKRIAIVGISRSGKKFGNYVCKDLAAKGYEVFPVHPAAETIDGLACHPDLKALEGKVDSLLISVAPAKVPPILEEAHQAGLKNIWLQQGSWSKEVQQTIDKLQLSVVTKKCILMYAPPVTSIHKFHRTIKSIFGGL